MEKIFIISHDYDGVYVEEFEPDHQGTKKAEDRYMEILANNQHDLGIHIDAVIRGRKLETKEVKVVSKISFS